MSIREVTQSVAARLLVILTDEDGIPADGVAYTDVTVSYRKFGGSFTTKDLTPTTAVLTSTGTQPFALVNGQTSIVEVDGVEDTATFLSGSFANIAAATAAEVVAVYNASIGGVVATAVSGAVRLTSTATGDDASIEVTGGTAEGELDFPATIENGADYWYELGNGLYEIRFTATELNTAGVFLFKVAGADFQQYVGVAEVVALDDNDTEVATLQTCVVSGHLLDLSGNPIEGAAVSARLIGLPQYNQNTAYIKDELITVVTDSNGQWFLTLARLATVEIFISAANYRRTLVVPNVSSSILAEIE